MADPSRRESKGPRCLWLARAIPLPLRQGDNKYTARLAQALAVAGASVTFMGLANPGGASLQHAKAFEGRIDWRIVPGRPKPTLLALASRLPFTAARCATTDYARQLDIILRERYFDAIILDHYWMSWTIDRLDSSKRAGARPLILHISHNFEPALASDIARNYRGDPLRKTALYANAWKIAKAVRNLAHAADIIVANTAEDAENLARLSPSNAKIVLTPGYDGPHAPDRQIVQATPRRVAIVGSHRWLPKQMNLAAFLAAADPILERAGVGIDVVGEVPDAFRRAWEARVKAARFHGFVDNLGEFLASRRMGLVIEETGGGFKHKILDYAFNRLPIAAIRGSMNGLPLTEGADYFCFDSMQDLANGVAAAIDDIERLNTMQDAAYKKCESAFDWSDRGRTLCNAIRQAVSRNRQHVAGSSHMST